VPAGVWLAATAGGLFLFLLLLPRRRDREQGAEVGAGGGGMDEVSSLAPINPVKRAPALANVPTLEDESVARWLRTSEDDRPEFGSSSPAPGSGAIKRRTQPRPRTTRDLQAGR
jgi:hypothetical protein